MPNLSTLYTGKGAGFNPQPFSQTQRAVEKVQSGILDAKKSQVKQAIGEAKDFQDMMDTNPISVASDTVLQRQSEAIQNFEKMGVEMLRRSGGKLTENDKMVLRSAKSQLEADQVAWQSDYKRILQDMQRVVGNPRYDQQAMTDAYNEYIKTGVYSGSGVQVAPMPYSDYKKKIHELASRQQKQVARPNEKGGTDTFMVSNWTVESARDNYAKMILSDDAQWKGVAQRFRSLPPIKKEQYFSEVDLNGDGNVDMSDAIINYGFEEEARDDFMKEESVVRSTGVMGGGDTLTAAQKNEADKKKRMEPEYMSENGITFKDSGTNYAWKPVDDGYTFMYKNENSKGVPISSDALSEIIPDGYIAAGDENTIKPLRLFSNGKVDAYVDVYKKKRSRKKGLNKIFDSLGEDVIIDGGNKYYRDKKGNIYAIEGKPETKKVNADYSLVKSYISPHFTGLGKTIKYDKGRGGVDDEFEKYKRQ